MENVFDISSTTCVFSFNNLSKFRDSAITMSGKVACREGATVLNRLQVTVNGNVYASSAVDDSDRRSRQQPRHF